MKTLFSIQHLARQLAASVAFLFTFVAHGTGAETPKPAASNGLSVHDEMTASILTWAWQMRATMESPKTPALSSHPSVSDLSVTEYFSLQQSLEKQTEHHFLQTVVLPLSAFGIDDDLRYSRENGLSLFQNTLPFLKGCSLKSERRGGSLFIKKRF